MDFVSWIETLEVNTGRSHVKLTVPKCLGFLLVVSNVDELITHKAMCCGNQGNSYEWSLISYLEFTD